MSSQTKYEVIVIGGGPAGMMAASQAAKQGRQVLLLEKNETLGKKLAITGGGRCNIFNAEEDQKILLNHYSEAQKFLHSPFAQFGLKETWDFFENLNLPIVVEARKRAFPKSQKATDVVQTLKKNLIKNKVEIKTKIAVSGFLFKKDQIIGVKTDRGNYLGQTIILATGGTSHQYTGSTGEGFNWLKKMGHTISPSNPNLVPLKVKEKWVKKLSGTSLSFIKITFGQDQPKEAGKFSATGKILFTHFGLSGPLILNSAREVKQLLKAGPVLTTIDLYPDTNMGANRNKILKIFNQNKNKTFKNILADCTPAGLEKAIATLLSPELLEKKVHSIGKKDRDNFADLLKALPLTITGTMGLDWAIVSDGGVSLKEIDTKTMRSKIHPNLALIGDVLDIPRPSGGYSLQLCWTTGYVAGNWA